MTIVVVGVVFGVLAGAAILAWPRAGLDPDDAALAGVSLPRFAGDVEEVVVHTAQGKNVPVRLRQGKLWPVHRVAVGARLTVVLTVQKPGWAGWLVGHRERRTFTIETPATHLRGRWLEVKAGAPVTVAFDALVSAVSFGGARVRRLAEPQKVVPVGVVARGSTRAGTIAVAAAARSWERLPAATPVSWFPARPYPQLLAAPKLGAALAPDRRLTLTFSDSVRDVLGSRRPTLTPATPGRWKLLDAHTLAFRPRGLGFGLGARVHVKLPRGVHLAGEAGSTLTRKLEWQVPEGSTLRLQQLLALLGYLPLTWESVGVSTPAVHEQIAAAIAPPAGQFSWRYANIPGELQALWHEGQPNQITRGAVMMFQDTHGLTVDALAGPRFWKQLLADEIAGRHRDDGYSYVYVHRNLPQSLNLWHNGQTILSSPGNTGVPAAPTQLGTFPVFEHIPSGTMSGTNPDGSRYNDPGIRYISYFNHGDAIHAFPRSSFGTPQSLGCVELPMDAAAKVWPYTPIGTLVTVEN